MKVSTILQALQAISPCREVIAFLDADTEPDPFWLQKLVAPLSRPDVGASSGMRWFAPEGRTVASLLRARWNLYALALMKRFNNAWGGSFAIRRDVLESSDLMDRWAGTVCEDTCVGDVLEDAGLKVALVPAVSMVNREQTTMRGCWHFMRRQMLFTRLHSRRWPVMVVFGLAFAGLATGLPVVAAVAAWQRDAIAFLLTAAAGFVLQLSVNWFESTMTTLAVSQSDTCRRWYQTDARSIERRIASNYILGLLCVVVSAVAIISAYHARKLKWRGITYDIGRSEVRLHEYAPFEHSPEPEAALGRMSI